MSKASVPERSAWPVFRGLRSIGPGDLGADLFAGLTLAAIAIPEQMATARLGGFAPQVGFFAFAAASLGFAVLGSNRQLSAGADSTITPIFAGGVALLAVAGSPQSLQLATLLALMIGAMLVVAGLLRLGWVADLLSAPVITGFLAGIGLHIVLSQAPAVLGLPQVGGDVYRRLGAIAANLAGVNLWSLAIGLGVFAGVFVLERIDKRLPGALIAMVAATLAT